MIYGYNRVVNSYAFGVIKLLVIFFKKKIFDTPKNHSYDNLLRGILFDQALFFSVGNDGCGMRECRKRGKEWVRVGKSDISFLSVGKGGNEWVRVNRS